MHQCTRSFAVVSRWSALFLSPLFALALAGCPSQDGAADPAAAPTPDPGAAPAPAPDDTNPPPADDPLDTDPMDGDPVAGEPAPVDPPDADPSTTDPGVDPMPAPPTTMNPMMLPASLFAESFNQRDGLISNEYAWKWKNLPAVRSPTWIVTSGSFFAKAGTGWSGVPDGSGPNVNSSNGTGSAVFRAHTQRADFDDVAVSVLLRNNRMVTTSRTPARSYDGLHIWLRHVSEYSLYAVSVNRRDNVVLIKKKVRGGSSNGGTYYNLSNTVRYNVPYGTWQRLTASAHNNADGSVTIRLHAGTRLIVAATDRGLGGPPIRAKASVGIRGDNCDFNVDDFVVTRY
jgi:hypothetical protein